MATPYPTLEEERVIEASKRLMQRGVNLLTMLTAEDTHDRSMLPRGTEFMPIRELTFCSGLLFRFVRSAGFGLAAGWGEGFLIAKVGVAGTAQTDYESILAEGWSAPLFVRYRMGSLGFTLGWSETLSINVLDSLDAVQMHATGMTGARSLVKACLGPLLSVSLPSAPLTTHVEKRCWPYTLVTGATIDISFDVLTVSPHKVINAALYGSDATPNSILDGSRPAPDGFAPLLERLDLLRARALAKIRARGLKASRILSIEESDSDDESSGDVEVGDAPKGRSVSTGDGKATSLPDSAAEGVGASLPTPPSAASLELAVRRGAQGDKPGIDRRPTPPAGEV